MKKLKWGETPWSKLNNKELLTEYTTMRSAIDSTYNAMNYLKTDTEEGIRSSVFFSMEGYGGKTLEESRQIIEIDNVSTSNDDLLLKIEQMYTALISALELLNQFKTGHEYNTFWLIESDGLGGVALDKVNNIIKCIHSEYDSESIYRSFFRYANGLLFENIHTKWVICPTCGQMTTSDKYDGNVCGDVMLNKDCRGTLRTLTFEDLKPEKI